MSNNLPQTAAAVLQPTIVAKPLTAPIDTGEENLYQHYHCSRSSMRVISSQGKTITFIKGHFITNDPEVIEYLNHEIKTNGLPGITMGELLSKKDSDPMAAIKKAAVAEYLEEQKAEAAAKAAGISKDMGSTVAKPAIAPASSKTVATGK